jgi:hypothetical protein
LRYAADAQIGGKLAQIGSRLVEGSAKKLADEFFAAFAAQAAALAPAAPMPAAAPAAEPIAAQATAGQPVLQPAPTVATATSSGLSPVLWIIGLVVIVAAILGFVALR